MISVSKIIERLRAIKELRDIGGSAAFTGALEGGRVFPAAYVMLVEEAVSRDPLYANASDAHAEPTFAVFIAARNLRDPRGAEAMETLEPLIRAVRKLLRGWTPDGACSPMRYLRGRVERVEDQVVWWRIEFATKYRIED